MLTQKEIDEFCDKAYYFCELFYKKFYFEVIKNEQGHEVFQVKFKDSLVAKEDGPVKS